MRCIAMQHDTTKPLGVFTELRRCAMPARFVPLVTRSRDENWGG